MADQNSTSNCSICNDLRGHDSKGPWPFYNVIHDFQEMQASAAEGCSTCLLLCQSVLHYIPESQQARQIRYRIGPGGPGEDVRAERRRPFLNIHVWFEDDYLAEVELFRLQDHKCPWTAIGTAFMTSGDTSSDMSFNNVKAWLNECQDTHIECKTGTKHGLPTRILDLGEQRSEDSVWPAVRLYDTQREVVPYMCLSHSWGTSTPIKTEKATLDARKRGIPWALLPRTFQDAITVTRRLGIRYLWIDTLCIIQDSKEDWEQEAAQMASIYRGSFLTLAASKGAGCYDSLFSKIPAQELPHEQSGITADSTPYSIYIRPAMPHWTPLRSNITHFPLLTRAWVYQERLLSPRVLHFGRELIWECNETTQCECYGPHRRQYYTHPKLDYVESFVKGQDIDDIAWTWRHMVMEYRCLNLTYDTDLLPALAGLASQTQGFRQTRYLAGLWEDMLISDLCWAALDFTVVPVASREKVFRWRAPSWSWAATLSRIDYSNINKTKDCAQIIRIDCLPERNNYLFGVARGALLTIRGQMIAATVRQSEAKDIPWYLKGEFGLEGNALLRHELVVGRSRDDADDLDFFPDDDLRLKGLEDGAAVYCLKMCQSENTINSLVLKCIDDERQVYARVGMAKQHVYQREVYDWYEDVMESVFSIS
ncbi:heterokaryon incompatibility protein-domain-containing protein [Aspergillus floccosus]